MIFQFYLVREEMLLSFIVPPALWIIRYVIHQMVYKTKLTKVVHPQYFMLMENAVGINIYQKLFWV